MAELITVPTFTFNQGDPYEGGDSEYPIVVKYWNGSIELEQNGDSVLINPFFFEKLFKEIKKHLPEATHKLNQ